MNSRGLLLVAAAFLLGACADEGPVSGPGTMTATLTGPNGPEGAAVIVILDEAVDVEGAPIGDTEVYSQAGIGSTQIVLINQVGGELLFQLAVADTTQPPAVVVQEVAGPDDALRTDLSAYAIEFRR